MFLFVIITDDENLQKNPTVSNDTQFVDINRHFLANFLCAVVTFILMAIVIVYLWADYLHILFMK